MRDEQGRFGRRHLRLRPSCYGKAMYSFAGSSMVGFEKLSAAALAALLLASPAEAAEKSFGLTGFDTIVLNADYVVEVTTRAPVRVVAVGSPDALDRVSIEASNGKLTISEKRFAGDEKRSNSGSPVTIRVNATVLRQATMAGAGSLTIDQMRGASVNLGLRGPGKMVVGKLTADRLSVALVGNGTMMLSGTAKKANIIASGSGVIDAGALPVTDLITDSEGTGEHRFNAVRTAAITARGIGKTVVLGRPTCTVRNAGSGSVVCGPQK